MEDVDVLAETDTNGDPSAGGRKIGEILDSYTEMARTQGAAVKRLCGDPAGVYKAFGEREYDLSMAHRVGLRTCGRY